MTTALERYTISSRCKTFAAVLLSRTRQTLTKLIGTYKADGVEEVEQIATAAQDAAKKAQAQAEQAAAGSNPELATFATMQLTSLSPTMSDVDAMSIPSLFPSGKSELSTKHVKSFATRASFTASRKSTRRKSNTSPALARKAFTRI